MEGGTGGRGAQLRSVLQGVGDIFSQKKQRATEALCTINIQAGEGRGRKLFKVLYGLCHSRRDSNPKMLVVVCNSVPCRFPKGLSALICFHVTLSKTRQLFSVKNVNFIFPLSGRQHTCAMDTAHLVGLGCKLSRLTGRRSNICNSTH